MKYFPHVRNLYINADEYLDGFLGLNWFPSDNAKQHVEVFEKKIARILFRLWKVYSSAWIMYEIATASTKEVHIIPSEFAPEAFKQNVSGGDIGAKTGTRDNTYVEATKIGEPGMTCLPTKKSERVKGTGEGADVVLAILPDKWTGKDGPGSAADEILIHELVHANRMVRGVRNTCFGAPRGWGDYEEFVAVTLCNVYSSEKGRPLRFGHMGFDKLPSGQADSKAYLKEYGYYLEGVKRDHPHLFKALKRAPGIPFNPFAHM